MRKVLIIGGGIGGLTAAVAMLRRGFDVQVFEAAPALQPVGKGIWVPTNAMQVLDRLGLAEAVREAGWPLERIQLRTWQGALLVDSDLAAVRAKFGHTTISIHRTALVETLAAALPAGAMHLGRRFESFVDAGDRVVAQFATGERVEGDVLVGADGIHSLVREQLCPNVPLRFHGQTCYRGVAELTLPPELAHVCWEVWGGRLRLGFSAIGAGQVYWYAAVSAPANSPLPAGKPLNLALADDYAHFTEPIPSILRQTPAARIIRTDLFDLTPIRRWSQGRVVLLGDAAHAMTPNLGQGGAQSIEDAWVLAEQLAAHSDPAVAISAYETLRRTRVLKIVRQAAEVGRLAHLRSRWLQWLRNALLRMTGTRMHRRQFDDLYTLRY